ncbi:hypothetical protein [Streptomyces sp. NPDC052225]
MAEIRHRRVPTQGIGLNNRGQVAFYAMDRENGGDVKILVAGLPDRATT